MCCRQKTLSPTSLRISRTIFSKNTVSILICLFFLSATVAAQCTGFDATDPIDGNYTFEANSTTCFTSDTTLRDVTFENNGTMCIAPAATVTIQNNMNTQNGNTAIWNFQRTLAFGQSPRISTNLDVTIESDGELRANTFGNNNFTFDGSVKSSLANNGTVPMPVLGFQSSSATNTIENLLVYTI